MQALTESIEGYVKTAAGRGIGGVPVSNGWDVVRTEANGRYVLPLWEHGRFVFVTAPVGGTARFYIDLLGDEGRDFVLEEPPSKRAADFSFVQITDMHISATRRAFGHHLKEDLERILQDVGDRIDFIVASGDLTGGGRAEDYQAYLEAVGTVALPVYHAAGNHDDDDGVDGGHFMDRLGPLYYSFDCGPVHFVVYDGEQHRRRGRDGQGADDDFGYVPSEQDRWMRRDLSLQPAGRPVVVINHFPWGDEFYGQWRGFPIVATLSGHWHASRLYRDGSVTHYNTPTLGFAGIDQSPRAYRLFSYRDGRLSAETRTLGPAGVFAGISFRPHSDNARGVVKWMGGRAPEPGADWPQLQGGPQRRGYAKSTLGPPLRLAWRAGTGGGIHMAAPVLAGGRVVQVFKNEDQIEGNGMVALAARDGSLCWSLATPTAVKGAPAYDDGRAFAVTVSGQVLALSWGTGDLLWRYQLADPARRWVYAGPLAYEGRIFVGVSSHFVALDPQSGKVLWRRDDLGKDDWVASYASPAALDGYVAVAFYTQPTALAVLDAETGETAWRLEGSKPYYMYSSPVIGPDGSVYTVSGSAVRSFDLKSGVLRWETPVPVQRLQATPALAGGRLFVATGSGALYALDAADGAVLWQWDAGEGAALFTPYVRQGKVTLTTPAVSNGYVYLGGADGCLYALEAATGICVWRYDLGVPLAAGPVVSGNGLWVGGCDGFVYAFTRDG